jgi:hypothetical protein
VSLNNPTQLSQPRANNPRRRCLIALLTDRIDASLTKQLVDWRLSPVIDSSHPNLEVIMANLEGQKAPAFTLPGSDGKKHSLSDYTGKNVVLWFYPKDDTPG